MSCLKCGACRAELRGRAQRLDAPEGAGGLGQKPSYLTNHRKYKIGDTDLTAILGLARVLVAMASSLLRAKRFVLPAGRLVARHASSPSTQFMSIYDMHDKQKDHAEPPPPREPPKHRGISAPARASRPPVIPIGVRRPLASVPLDTEPEPARRLIRSWLRRVDRTTLARITAAVQAEKGKKATVKGMIARFSEAVGHDHALVASFEEFVKGGADAPAPEHCSEAVSDEACQAQRIELASALLRCRKSAPALMGSFSGPSEHLKLAPLVFGALHEVTDPAALDMDDDAGLGFGSELVRAGRRDLGRSGVTAPLTEADFGDDEGDRAALALAAWLCKELPPSALVGMAELLAQADWAVAQNQLHGRAPNASAREHFLKLTEVLGHHWAGVAPSLLRFLRVYDDEAAAACPFRAKSREAARLAEEELLLPVLLARSKYVTSFVKYAADPMLQPERAEAVRGDGDDEEEEEEDEDDDDEEEEEEKGSGVALEAEGSGEKQRVGRGMEYRTEPASLYDTVFVEAELRASGASVDREDLTSGDPANVAKGRRLRVGMRAEVGDEEALMELVAHAAEAARVARRKRPKPEVPAWAWERYHKAVAVASSAGTTIPPYVPPPPSPVPLPAPVAAGCWDVGRTVLIRNLPPEVTAHAVATALRRCGTVVAVHMYNAADSESGGTGGSGGDWAPEAQRGDVESVEEEEEEEEEEEGEEGLGEEEEEDWDMVTTVGSRCKAAAPAVRPASDPFLGLWAPGMSTAEQAAARAKLREKDRAEEMGLGKQDLKDLRAARRATRVVATAAIKAAKAAAAAAEKAARAHSRAAKAKADATKAAVLAGKSARGRKVGVKSVIAAKHLAGRRGSDTYAFVEFADESGVGIATSHAARIFGITIGERGSRAQPVDEAVRERSCFPVPAQEARTLFLHPVAPSGGAPLTSEMEGWLSGALAPLLHVRALRGASALLTQVAPCIFKVDFPSHEAAAWALRRLAPDGIGDMPRPGLEPAPVLFQWLSVADRTAKEAEGRLPAARASADADAAAAAASELRASLRAKGFVRAQPGTCAGREEAGPRQGTRKLAERGFLK